MGKLLQGCRGGGGAWGGLVSRGTLGFCRNPPDSVVWGSSLCFCCGISTNIEGVKCCLQELQAAKPCLTYFSLGACARLPLERGKKLREVLREKGLLHRFFQHHRYDIGTKFPHAFPNGTEVATEPLLNTLDVSVGFVPRRRSPGVVCGMPIPMSVLCMDQT